MHEGWYIDRAGERLGPYRWEELSQFAGEGRLHSADQIWHPGDKRWIAAGQLPGLILTHSQPPPEHPPGPFGNAGVSGARARRKKKGGCLGCLLWLLGTAALFAGGAVLLFFILGNRPSKNIIFEKGSTAVRETIGSAGGAVTVDRPGEALDGFAIEAPAGAFAKNTRFTVTYHPITAHNLGPYFNPVTPLIKVDNGGRYSAEPMVVTIPVPRDPDSFTMAFYYDRQAGTLEGLPLVGSGDGFITVATRHFSDLVASSISFNELRGKLDIDTGFRPGYDDWQFTNYGSLVAPRGHCAGQAVSAMWYFYERRLKGERPLYGRYDNNDRGYGTIDFWQDDSWGYRLASAVQQDIDWDRLIRRILLDYRGYDDNLTFMAFAYAMLITGEPQYVGIASSTKPGSHAIIAYRLEQDKIYVADPNYPGTERVIRYTGGRFLPYNSGANATDIASGNEVSYDRIGYFAKTAIVEWARVGERWAELDRGAVAGDLFPAYPLEVQIAGDDGQRWVPLTDGFTTTTAETARVVRRSDGNTIDMTGKLAFRATPRYTNVYYYAYRGTDLLAGNTTSREPLFILNLEEGVNDSGFWVWEKHDDKVRYVDFQRYIIIYNEDDITGSWSGAIVFEEAGNLAQYLEDIFVHLVSLFARDYFAGDPRQAFRDALKPEGIGVPHEFALQIEAVAGAKDRYDVNFVMIESGGDAFETRTRATYRDGVLAFDIKHPDGSTFTLRGRLTNNNTINGTFTANAWGIIKNAASGYWQVERQE